MCGSAERILRPGGELHPLLEREVLCLAENWSHVLLLQLTRLQVKEKHTLKRTLQRAGSMQRLCFILCRSTQLSVRAGCCLKGVLPLCHLTMRSLCCICLGADICPVARSAGPGTMHLQNNNVTFIFNSLVFWVHLHPDQFPVGRFRICKSDGVVQYRGWRPTANRLKEEKRWSRNDRSTNVMVNGNLSIIFCINMRARSTWMKLAANT